MLLFHTPQCCLTQCSVSLLVISVHPPGASRVSSTHCQGPSLSLFWAGLLTPGLLQGIVWGGEQPVFSCPSCGHASPLRFFVPAVLTMMQSSPRGRVGLLPDSLEGPAASGGGRHCRWWLKGEAWLACRCWCRSQPCC